MQGTLPTGIIYRDFQSPAFSVTSGTVGTYLTTLRIDASLTGKTPIGVSLISIQHAGIYIPSASLEGNDIIINLWRAWAGTREVVAGDLVARVLYE